MKTEYRKTTFRATRIHCKYFRRGNFCENPKHHGTDNENVGKCLARHCPRWQHMRKMETTGSE